MDNIFKLFKKVEKSTVKLGDKFRDYIEKSGDSLSLSIKNISTENQ